MCDATKCDETYGDYKVPTELSIFRKLLTSFLQLQYSRAL